MNSSGKVLTIFLVIIAILLISLTAISLFFFQKETVRRKSVEVTLEEYRTEKKKMENALNMLKKQGFLLQEKNKEADERVNDLSDELELEKGLREEMKLETASLKDEMAKALQAKESLAEELKAKEELQEKMTADLLNSEQKIKELEAQLKAEMERGQKLGELYEQKQNEQETSSEIDREMLRESSGGQVSDQQGGMPIMSSPVALAEEETTDTSVDMDSSEPILTLEVELDEIVVVPQGGEDLEDDLEFDDSISSVDGRVLSVDTETEFVIVNIGEKDGVEVGAVLSVYRDQNYLGDIKITRLQSEMSAADLIPPFSVKKIQKNDRIKVK